MISYSFYEVDSRILQYTRALVERGDEVDVIALRRKGAANFETIAGVNVYRVQTRTVDETTNLGYLSRILRFLFITTKLITERHFANPYHIVHVHSVPDFLVFAALIPKLFGASVVLDIHDILPEFYASKFNLSSSTLLFRTLLLCEKISAKFADHVIVANEIWQEKLISRSICAERCTTVRNYPDERIFFPRPRNSNDGRFVILFPGTFNRHQGLDIAIRAFAQVADVIPGAEFWIYGEGPERRTLLKLRESLGLTGRVHIEGFLPIDEIAAIMASADLAVVPKRVSTVFGSEAASTKIMEFMSIGVPVIVSRTKIDTLYHGESMVRFFEPENEKDLANAILELWRNPELRRNLVENSSQYVLQHNWGSKKQEYLDLLESLIHPTISETGVHA
jgi:glycosyltransferase involved in cell wall biosynthesis